MAEADAGTIELPKQPDNKLTSLGDSKLDQYRQEHLSSETPTLPRPELINNPDYWRLEHDEYLKLMDEWAWAGASDEELDKRARISARRITQQRLLDRNKIDELAVLAYKDTVTGELNRQGLTHALSRLGPDEKATLLFIDLDKFKPVNDTYGHAMGDKVLAVIAKRLAGIVRPTDPIAHHYVEGEPTNGSSGRYGGDEFMVVLNGTEDEQVIIRVAQKILEALNEPIEIDGVTITIGGSTGVARRSEAKYDDLEMLRVADSRLYEAKKAKSSR